MNGKKRCSSCKLVRRIEYFQKPMSLFLFNTCRNCRLKKKRNYRKRKDRRHDSASLSTESSGSLLDPFDSHEFYCTGEARTHFPASAEVPDPGSKSCFSSAIYSQTELCPTSKWIVKEEMSMDSSSVVAKAVYHFTLFNVPRAT